MEYTKRCKVCGHIFCYTDQDVKDNTVNAAMGVFSAIGQIGAALGGSMLDMHMAASNNERVQSKITDFNKCPVCHSMNLELITREELNKINSTQVTEKSAPEIKINTNASAESLLRRAYLFLEDRKWETANTYCDAVLDMEPENAEAYLGKLLAELQLTERAKLADLAEPFDENENYKKIVRFANDELLNEISGYIEHIKTRNENTRKEKIYREALDDFRSAYSSVNFENAARKFESVREYNDSEEYYAKCVERAEEEKIKEKEKAEEARIAAEKKAEADKAERERKEKRNRIIKIVASVLVSVAIVSFIAFFGFIEPAINYKTALEFANNGQYENAVSGFMALGDYKDSKEQIYIIACNYLDEKQYKEASDTFKLIREYKDSENKEVNSFKEYVKSKKIGEIIEFGSYEQDNNSENGEETIEWRILEKEGDKVFIISKKILEAEQFHWSERDITWEESWLKIFLNGSFKNVAFDSIEKKMILKESQAGEIFVLDYNEFSKYVKESPISTAYARIKANEEVLSDVDHLWIRDTYKGEAYYCVEFFGEYSFIAGNMTFYYGILPAMWIDLSAVE